MGRVAYQIYLLTGLRFIGDASVYCIIAFFELLQANLAISLSERKQWLLYAIGLGIAVISLCTRGVRLDKERIIRDREKILTEIEKEKLRKLKLENDILEGSD